MRRNAAAVHGTDLFIHFYYSIIKYNGLVRMLGNVERSLEKRKNFSSKSKLN
jgi:hypothetical protein